MLYYKEYKGHESKIVGKRKKIDNTIYTFDIETTSYYLLNNKVYAGITYNNLNEDQKEEAIPQSCMYIWMFGINDKVYYGRTWDEFVEFIEELELNVPEKKIIFVHNLSFEFQFFKSVFKVNNVFARKSHKVIRCELEDYNIEFRCSFTMSNCALASLPRLYKLPVEKKVGDLDYSKLRTSITELTDKEMGYCEYDCLVVYYYILQELETYERIDKIPLTNTGHVRKELKDAVMDDYSYRNKVRRSINIDPHVYNLLVECFAGGYTHANWIHADEIIENVDSWDFTSSYPYVMVTHKFPSSEFKKCNIKTLKDLNNRFAYILIVRFKDLKCKYYNNYISMSKCRYIKGARYDNGRIIQADEIEIVLTDIDFKLILDMYDCTYEITESYFSFYNYLPIQYIKFILKKYVNKTKFKGVEGKELEYMKEKNRFNSLYGMTVTNTIRDRVEYDDAKGWEEIPLTNEEIESSLEEEKKKAFLSFAYGVWVTAYARNNLLKNVIKLDEYVIYCDTDSMKLCPGYDKKVIEDYNDFVKRKIEFVSKKLDIDIENFAPLDTKGKKRMLGVFDADEHYDRFITQGAKKYAFEIDGKIGITVAGVPKTGAKQLKKLEDFKDDLVFEFENTNKNLLFYCEDMKEVVIKDYLGKEYKVNDKSGCSLLPNTYKLGKSIEYAELISEKSSKRSIYKE